MKKKKTALKILCAALAIIVICAGGTVAYLYNNGLFKPAHRFVEPSDGQIKVACVGDSVTYSMQMKNWSKNAYPFVLRKLLGEKYCAENFGFSGRTVSENGDRPFVFEKLYTQSLEFEPDIVILQIGSNDSKKYNWKGADEFTSYYKKLLDSYIALESKPKIFICTPPPAYAVNGVVKYDIEPDTIKNEICPAIRQIAKEYDINLIDLEKLFENKPELFADGLHPNPEGGKLLAQTVYDAIKKEVS